IFGPTIDSRRNGAGASGRAGGYALLEDEAEFLGLVLQGGELALHVFALQRQSLLRILCLDELVSKIEGGVYILLGVGQHVSADRLRSALRRVGRVARDACRALGDRQEALEGFSRLVDAAVGEIAQLIWNFKRRIGHFLPFPLPSRIGGPLVDDSYSRLFAAVQHNSRRTQ